MQLMPIINIQLSPQISPRCQVPVKLPPILSWPFDSYCATVKLLVPSLSSAPENAFEDRLS